VEVAEAVDALVVQRLESQRLAIERECLCLVLDKQDNTCELTKYETVLSPVR
jgi:DNA polymerase III delta subunit